MYLAGETNCFDGSIASLIINTYFKYMVARGTMFIEFIGESPAFLGKHQPFAIQLGPEITGQLHYYL